MKQDNLSDHDNWITGLIIGSSCLWGILSLAWLAFLVWAIYTLVTAVAN